MGLEDADAYLDWFSTASREEVASSRAANYVKYFSTSDDKILIEAMEDILRNLFHEGVERGRLEVLNQMKEKIEELES